MTPLLAYRLRRDVNGSFETVYRRHVRDVYGFALGLLGNPDDAEDVTQTTFLNAYRALQRGERVQNLRAWLLAIAHNVCRQRFRTASRRPQEVELDPETAEAYADEDAPTAQEIRGAMSKLGFNQRTVLVLREIEGLSYGEIAQAMGVSLSAVETLLFRARQALREQLEAAEHDLGCDAVMRLISLQLDGKLSRADRGLLRAHLRGCAECARFARSQRARKRAMPSLVAVPLPASLSGVFGGGAGLVTTKVAAVAASAALVGAGTLVQTGVVDVPGTAKREAVTTPVVNAAAEDVSASASGLSGGALEFGIAALDRAPNGASPTPGRRSANGQRSVAGGIGPGAASGTGTATAAAAAAASGDGSAASGSGDGSGGSGLGVAPGSVVAVGEAAGVTPPAPVNEAVGTVGGAVGGATGAVGGATGPVGGATGPVGGVTGPVGGVTGPVGGAAGAVGGAAGGAAGGAQSNLPSVPVSPPVRPPSLPPVPPVPLPAPGGGPSLP